MDRNIKLSFQEEMEREAKKIEEELNAHPELNDVTASADLDAALLKQIQAYETEQKKNTGETEKKCIKFPRNKRFLFTFVAVLTLMCAMGATSIGSKSYRKQVEHSDYGTQKVQNVDVQDMEKQESSEEGEIFAYQEVEKEIGILPVRLTCKPDNMEFLRHQIDHEEQRAKLFYKYKNNMLRYDIYKNESDSSLGQNQDDQVLDEYVIEVQGQTVNLKKIMVHEAKEERSVLSFKYKGVNYQLYGVLNMEEMKKIAKNLKFL